MKIWLPGIPHNLGSRRKEVVCKGKWNGRPGRGGEMLGEGKASTTLPDPHATLIPPSSVPSQGVPPWPAPFPSSTYLPSLP